VPWLCHETSPSPRLKLTSLGECQIQSICRKYSPGDSNARTIIWAADSTQEQATDSEIVHQPSMRKKMVLRMPSTRFKMVEVKDLEGKGREFQRGYDWECWGYWFSGVNS